MVCVGKYPGGRADSGFYRVLLKLLGMCSVLLSYLYLGCACMGSTVRSYSSYRVKKNPRMSQFGVSPSQPNQLVSEAKLKAEPSSVQTEDRSLPKHPAREWMTVRPRDRHRQAPLLMQRRSSTLGANMRLERRQLSLNKTFRLNLKDCQPHAPGLDIRHAPASRTECSRTLFTGCYKWHSHSRKRCT